jgi:hypothetical protein
VDPSVFSVTAATNSDENSDPALAVLFKRIGTGGTALSDADYVYAVIKHYLPKSYGLVEKLHAMGNIAGLLSATDVVMTAVRLAAAEFYPTTGKPLTDWESPSKQQFHSLIKQKQADNDFLLKGFLPLVEHGSLMTAFDRLTALLKYDPDNNPNGLPLHAFPLLKRPLIQILLRWIRCAHLSNPTDLDSLLNNSRDDILRFVMYWQLCVIDPAKASLQAFKILVPEDAPFPAKQIVTAFIESGVARPVIAPDKLDKTLVYTADANKIRGWKRFVIPLKMKQEDKLAIDLYRSWWGRNVGQHTRPMLLWLQRETVAGFQGSPVADREEDTPYDYDHICPSNHWNNWSGSAGNIDSLMQFIDKVKGEDGEGHLYIGNSIGNLRVWDSSMNRHDGDATPTEKLKLDDEIERGKLLNGSAIHASEIDGWKACSEGKRSWNSDRALAFQQVVEQRAFTLYERYYHELDFSVWNEALVETPQTEQ